MAPRMPNHYEQLGVATSATATEIRRAYRILARRYHPDVNPGRASEERFKAIAQAYDVLSDAKKRAVYDAEFLMSARESLNARVRAYQRQQQAGRAQKRHRSARPPSGLFQEPSPTVERADAPPRAQRRPPARKEPLLAKLGQFVRRSMQGGTPGADLQKVTVVEVSVSLRDAILGTRKTVEIENGEAVKKVSVKIPAGVRTGAIIRLRDKKNPKEELLVLPRVATHPIMSLEPKGLIVEIPISVKEAIVGASITLPTLDDPVVITVPPGSQSGHEIRVKEKGVPNREGSRGDLFYRLMIYIPDAVNAVGIKARSEELEGYYAAPLRQTLPRSLLDVAS